jgi:suppressor for copper-sensitivity B
MQGAYRRFVVAAILVVAVLIFASSAFAQKGGGFGGLGGGFLQGGGSPAVSVTGQFTVPSDGKPGYLVVTAKIKPEWHIYSITQPEGGPVRTKINLKPSDQYRVAGPFQATSEPEKKKEAVFGDVIVESHYGSVMWFAPLELAPGVNPESVKIEGSVFAQPCDANSCLPPQTFAFTASLGQGVDVAALGGNASERQPARPIVTTTEQSSTPFLVAVLTGFLGGLLLNIMPCVLPVIGLKIFSFVEQSGHCRRQALMLNIWFSLGLLSVFFLLGTLAVVWGFGWGQLFHYKGFNIGLAAVVFVMGLSFLGVWEIPIPGFVGGREANELMQKEGAVGAFAKGVLTTLLATPCSAPFLGTALVFTVAQPPAITYAIFMAIGLGMASPYLLIGAFPQLIRFLPRPGAWMDTFKQIMGFVLLGTVVFLLTFIEQAYVVPTVGLLFGLWAACWWIGRTPFTAELGEKLRAWAGAAAFAGVVWIVMFGGWFQGGAHELPWKPFSQATFEELTQADKTVMVDFTADWCLTCKVMEASVLNTQEMREAVEANQVVPLKADWTHGDEEVTRMLDALGSKQVPVLAIFPRGNADKPIVFRGGYTKQNVLDALAEARGTQTDAGVQAAGVLGSSPSASW